MNSKHIEVLEKMLDGQLAELTRAHEDNDIDEMETAVRAYGMTCATLSNARDASNLILKADYIKKESEAVEKNAKRFYEMLERIYNRAIEDAKHGGDTQ